MCLAAGLHWDLLTSMVYDRNVESLYPLENSHKSWNVNKDYDLLEEIVSGYENLEEAKAELKQKLKQHVSICSWK